ncbi:MAG: hypothetical protein KDK34_04065, partial [Leptospiraceae bacterium]|nr:hypothetical protein [Leptospiraceae bacterium]
SFLYHHFLNNCTIRVRDIIDREMGGRLKSYFENRPADGITFRSSSMDLMFSNPILWYGTNLIMGPAVDRPVSEWELMYLPLEFMRLMDEYRLAHPTDASTQQSSSVYVGPIETYLEYQHPPEEDGTVFNWVGMFLFEAIVIGVLFIWPALAPASPRARTAFRIGWLSWNLGAGFIGALLLVLWLGTNHDSMDNNLNILAYTPFHLFLPLIVWRVRKSFQNAPRVIVQLHAVLMFIPVVGLILSWLVPQYSWPFFLHAILIQFCIWLRLYRRYQHNDN